MRISFKTAMTVRESENGILKNVGTWRATSYKPMSNTAITLIALIITIIVLLILAAVTLNMVIRRKWNNNKSTEWQKKKQI